MVARFFAVRATSHEQQRSSDDGEFSQETLDTKEVRTEARSKGSGRSGLHVPVPVSDSLARHRLVVALSLLLLSCPSSTTDGIGTLRGNQRKLFDGNGWEDPVCGPAETETESPINCCTRNDRPICPEFTDYDIVDVKVKGQRVAVLFQANNGNQLLLSDDRGDTWRSIGVGSVGTIATTQSMSILLASGSRLRAMRHGMTGFFELAQPWNRSRRWRA